MLLFVIDHLDSESDVAFVERIYKEFMPMIKRRIYKHIPNMTVCDDIAHDCILDIIKYLDSIKRVPEDKLRVYISVCVENNIKRYLKKATKELTGIEETVSNNNNLASGTDVADEVEVKYNYETLRKGFDKLKDRDKSIIVMRYDLELNDELIANALLIDKNSVRMTALRSVQKLKNAIKTLEEF